MLTIDRWVLLSVVVGLSGYGVSDIASATEAISVGRYSTLAPVPTVAQADLLAAIVTVTFPESVDTVGDAVRDLLKGTGYRLSGESTAEPIRSVLLQLALPDLHRSLGPMSVRMALETLAGPAFRLIEDPVHRLVSFERCEQSIP